MRDEETGEAPHRRPALAAAHTQTLIYAQAMRRALGLDTRAALYFSTKGGKPARAVRRAPSCFEEERGDGRIRASRRASRARAAAWTSMPLLDRVEAASENACASSRRQRCRRRPGVGQAAHAPLSYNHEGTFVGRDVDHEPFDFGAQQLQIVKTLDRPLFVWRAPVQVKTSPSRAASSYALSRPNPVRSLSIWTRCSPLPLPKMPRPRFATGAPCAYRRGHGRGSTDRRRAWISTKCAYPARTRGLGIDPEFTVLTDTDDSWTRR